MFPLQVSLTLALVLGYGFYMRNRAPQLRRRLSAIPRGKRAALGIGGFLLSAVLLLGGLMLATSLDPKPSDGLTPAAWACVALCALGAVHFQTLAAGIMVSLALDPETGRPAQPSNPQTNPESES